MALSKETKIDQVTVTENGTVLVREVTCILEDGVQLSQTYHRTSLVPASDLTGAAAQVVAICNAAWTDEVIAAYKEKLNDYVNT
jgi:hypothetical protein